LRKHKSPWDSGTSGGGGGDVQRVRCSKGQFTEKYEGRRKVFKRKKTKAKAQTSNKHSVMEFGG